jgi:hypothetical protein
MLEFDHKIKKNGISILKKISLLSSP